MSALTQDISYAIRMLRRNPGFATIAVITLALGIGANTAIFSIVNAVLLRPLPYPDPGEIVQVNLVWRGGGINDSFTAPEFEFYRDHASAFKAIAGFRGGEDLEIKRRGTSEWIKPLRVTDGFFRVLGVSPALGRGILRDETRPSSVRSAVLSHELWHTAFGADPAVIGQQFEAGGDSYTIVGVMPPGFNFVGQPADVFTSLQLGTSIEDTGMNTGVIARIKPGMSLVAAQGSIAVTFQAARQQGLVPTGEQATELVNYQTWLLGDLRPSLFMLFGAVGLLLLIACANVASLIMARANSRQREVSIQLALGAERLQLLRQFLAEGLLIALVGGATGLLAAAWTLKALVASIPWSVPSEVRIGVDDRVLAFALLMAVATSVVFALTSYWQTSKSDLNLSLKEGGAQGGRSTTRSRTRNVLVTGEVALSLMLLVGAGLLIKSLYRLHQQKLGFDPSHVYTMTTPFAPEASATPTQVWTFEQQVLEKLRVLPGVTSAAVISKLPLTGPNNLPTQHEGYPRDSIGGMEYRAVSPDYFRAMRIPILQGRGIQDTDTASSTPVVIVSETVARAWWPGKSPIGDHIVVGEYQGRQIPEILEPPREVVGVVPDVKNLAIDELQPTTIYVPASQLSKAGFGSTSWVVRVRGKVDVGSAMRAAVLAVNPDQRVLNLASMSDIVSRSVAHPSFNALLMALFAALALALTSVGIYGVLSFHVSRRTQEIGIRMALGAERNRVILMVVGEGATLAAVGIAIGLALALILSRFLSSVLSGAQGGDPVVYASGAIALMAAALLASYVPARRAARVDPLVALRYE